MISTKNTALVLIDVQEKLLRFAKAGLAVAIMKGKSYLSMGSVSMGIAGSIVQENLFQEYLGMRNEYIDMTEFLRRIDQELYDKNEYYCKIIPLIKIHLRYSIFL